MNILPSTEIRKNYDGISRYCKQTGQPVYLTKRGNGDLVVMDIDAFNALLQDIANRESVLEAHASYLAGTRTYALEETIAMMRAIVKSK